MTASLSLLAYMVSQALARHIFNQLRAKLDRSDFRFYNGSDMLAPVSRGKIENFLCSLGVRRKGAQRESHHRDPDGMWRKSRHCCRTPQVASSCMRRFQKPPFSTSRRRGDSPWITASNHFEMRLRSYPSAVRPTAS
jgi:hypothetical protein